MVLGAAGGQQNLAQNAADTNNFLMTDIWNPASNPYLSQAVDAAVRPITENYEQVVKPGIADEFIGAGQQFGGSRRGVAEGVAAGKYLNSVGDTASKLVQDQYAANLGATEKALALAPTTTQNLTTPGLTTSGVGDVRQRMAQALLGEEASNFNYDENAGFLQSKELLALLAGLPGGSTTASAPINSAPWWQQALGIGSTAAGLAGAVAPAGIGSAAALLPFL